jgi:hypothetical protein
MEATMPGIYHYVGSRGWVPGTLWVGSSPEPGTIRYCFTSERADDLPVYPRPRATKGRAEGLCWSEEIHEHNVRFQRLYLTPAGHQIFRLRVKSPAPRPSARRGVPEWHLFAARDAQGVVDQLSMVRSEG